MAGGQPWTPEQDHAVRTLPPSAYNEWAVRSGFPERGVSAILKRRTLLNQMGEAPDAPRNVTGGYRTATPAPAPEAAGDVGSRIPHVSVARRTVQHAPRSAQNGTDLSATPQDKRTNTLGWRDHLAFVQTVQRYREQGSRSQDTGIVRIDTDRPVCVLVLSDTHIGSVGADIDAFTRVTDDILSIPELFVILAGDLLNMAIQIKHGVGALQEDVLTPGQQFDFLEDWLGEVQHKVLAACWDNHTQEREERAVGTSSYARMLGQRVIFHAGIGHLTVGVGDQSYEWAVSHRFRGRSELNPVHGQMKYLRMMAPDREIVAAGDSHVPGYAWFIHGGQPRLALNAGSLHTGSRFAKRYYSLTTSPAYPCVALWPDEHRVVCFPSVADWLAQR